MASFDLAIPITLQWEGGYNNNPSDPGGETNYGISKRSYPDIDISSLTREQAIEIYRRDFWKYDGIVSQPIASKLFDTGVNLGLVRAIACIQRVIGVPADGRYGALTQGGINGSPEAYVLTTYRQKLVQYYTDLVSEKPELSRFLEGWLRRANS